MKHERKIVAFIIHPKIGAIKVWIKHQQSNGNYNVDTPLGMFKNVPPERLLLPEKLPTSIDL